MKTIISNSGTETAKYFEYDIDIKNDRCVKLTIKEDPDPKFVNWISEEIYIRRSLRNDSFMERGILYIGKTKGTLDIYVTRDFVDMIEMHIKAYMDTLEPEFRYTLTPEDLNLTIRVIDHEVERLNKDNYFQFWMFAEGKKLHGETTVFGRVVGISKDGFVILENKDCRWEVTRESCKLLKLKTVWTKKIGLVYS